MKVNFQGKHINCTCDIKILPRVEEDLRNTTSIIIDGISYNIKDIFHEIKINTFTQQCDEEYTVFLE